MNWQKHWAVWGFVLLTLGISSCGGDSFTSVGSNIRTSVRIEIPRQTITETGTQVRVVALSGTNEVGSTGTLVIGNQMVLQGQINNLAVGDYSLICQTLDASGNIISRGTPVPIRVGSEPVLGIEVLCNTSTVLGTGVLQFTVVWPTIDDVDLSVTSPLGEIVDFSNPQVPSGGILDADANAACGNTTLTPVENIFWPSTGAPFGIYTIDVNLFSRCEPVTTPIPFTLTVRINGVPQVFQGSLDDQIRRQIFDIEYLADTPSPSSSPTQVPLEIVGR